MTQERAEYPIVDLHCDLLAYLATVENAQPTSTHDIGCAIPYLQEGNVKLQVLAIYSGGRETAARFTPTQYHWFNRLLTDHGGIFTSVSDSKDVTGMLCADRIGIIASIENASGLCDENESLDTAFSRLERIIDETGRVLYISLTHHGENRFGGGNHTTKGLLDDGRVLLDYIDGRRIAVDLSHTSDALAHGILDYIDKKGLDIPVIASHSNFRAVFNHVRNLPDELAGVVIDRKGLIGMNFLRAFLHPDDPNMLVRHILHGFEIGAGETLCFGADFFCPKTHPDKSGIPFFFREHEHAGKYQQILQSLESVLDPEQRKALAYGNAVRFLQRIWDNMT